MFLYRTVLVTLFVVLSSAGASEMAPKESLRFYMDSPSDLNREIDYSQYLNQTLTLDFRLQYPVGLVATSMSHLVGEFDVSINCYEDFVEQHQLDQELFETALSLQDSMNTEHGFVIFKNIQTGEFTSTAIFSSGMEATLLIDDAKAEIENISDRLSTESGYEVFFVHTHPSVFPFGASDKRASERLLRWIKSSMIIEDFYGIAIARSSEGPCEGFSFSTKL